MKLLNRRRGRGGLINSRRGLYARLRFKEEGNGKGEGCFSFYSFRGDSVFGFLGLFRIEDNYCIGNNYETGMKYFYELRFRFHPNDIVCYCISHNVVSF